MAVQKWSRVRRFAGSPFTVSRPSTHIKIFKGHHNSSLGDCWAPQNEQRAAMQQNSSMCNHRSRKMAKKVRNSPFKARNLSNKLKLPPLKNCHWNVVKTRTWRHSSGGSFPWRLQVGTNITRNCPAIATQSPSPRSLRQEGQHKCNYNTLIYLPVK